MFVENTESPDMRRRIDSEVSRILREAYHRVKTLLVSTPFLSHTIINASCHAENGQLTLLHFSTASRHATLSFTLQSASLPEANNAEETALSCCRRCASLHGLRVLWVLWNALLHMACRHMWVLMRMLCPADGEGGASAPPGQGAAGARDADAGRHPGRAGGHLQQDPRAARGRPRSRGAPGRVQSAPGQRGRPVTLRAPPLSDERGPV